jgi:sugar lactone lactonase YvrE
MAIFKPVISIIGYGPGDGLELFEATDIYRWDVDNRPLENLADNDVAIKDAVDALVDEIEDAYDGKLWPTGVDNTFTTLDNRLDNMDVFLQELFEVRNVQYSSFVQTATFLRERYTSGFLNGPFPDTFVRSNFAMENNEAMPSPFGGFYVPETSESIEDQNQPDQDVKNMVAMETRIEQDGVAWTATKKPIYVHVNGFIVPMLNCHGGTRETDQSIDDHRAHGIYGPVTIGFPEAPATGHRFDFAFLEVWLQEVSQTGGTFYPYGSRDYSNWSGRVQLGVGDALEDNFLGQVAHRDLVTYDETNWGFSVFVRADLTDIDWDTETPVCADNGAGALVGATCNGTIDYDTGEWEITFDGGSEPGVGELIVAVYRYNGVADPDTETVRGTISFLPNGNYLQVQHKIRVIPGVDYEQYPFWFNDPAVEARAGNDMPVTNYVYHNALNDIHDGSLWRAGDGDSASKADLGTFDGYVYAVPLCAWSRYNRAPWTTINQNGGVDRLDGHQYGVCEDAQFLDLRPVVLAERYDMRAAAENTLDRIIRGAHHSIFGEAQTDYEDTNDWTGQDIWGTEVPELWRIHPRVGLAADPDINIVRDIGLSISTDPLSVDYPAPVAHHDGVRQVYSPQEEVQQVPIYIEDVDNSDTCTPAIVVTYDHLTKVITLSTTDNTLSGYSTIAGQGVIINDSYPRLYWRTTRQPVKLSSLWSGLGTNTATATIDDSAATFVSSGTIDGFVDLLYPECTAIARPVKEIDAVQFYDGIANYNTIIAGNEDGSADDPDIVAWKLNLTSPLEPGFQLPNGICVDPTNTYIYVCDSANNRVVKLLASDMTHVAQWPTLANYPVDFSGFTAATDLRYPVDVACDAAGNVYIADREDHRVVKVNGDLDTYIGCFGNSGTATNDPTSTTELNSPEGVTVDSSGNLFISDTGLYRLVKVTAAALIPAGNIGYVAHIGNGFSGVGIDQFIQPMGLDIGAIGLDDYVYVADKNRVVQVDATSMEVTNILGARNTSNVQKFYRHMYATFYGFQEDSVTGEKYAVQHDRRMLYKFDAYWNLIATFGVDGVAGWDDPGWDVDVTNQTHLQFPGDLILDEDANLLYLAVSSHEQNDTGAIYIFNTDLEIQAIYKTPFGANGGPKGLALYPAADTTARLYVNAGPRIVKISLPAAGGRANTAGWAVVWTLTNSTVGFTLGDQFRQPYDLELNTSGDELYVSDIMRGEVVQLNPVPNPPTIIDRCTVGSVWPPPDNVGAPLGISLAHDEQYLYVCGHGDANWVGNETVPHIRVIDTTSMTIVERLIDSSNWAPGDHPVNIRFDMNGDIYLMMSRSLLVYEADVTGFQYTGTAPGELSNFLYNTYSLPVTIDLTLPIPWVNCRAVHTKNNILYVADPFANSVTSVHMDSLLVLGTASSPAMVNRGKASTAGPAGVAVIGNRLYLADTFNNRLLSSHTCCPIVERGTGRIQYLITPEEAAYTTFQVRYTPYQGIWQRLAGGGVYGRHFVTDNNQMYVTTLGRGTPTYIDPGSGVTHYSNMLSHLPCPVDVPYKAIEGLPGCRITNEYLIAPENLPLALGTVGPYLQLPVLNRYPASAQEMNPWYSSGSRFDFNRFFFNQGAGPGNAVDASGTPIEVYNLFTPRGFFANGFTPGFDVLTTFPLQSPCIPRILFSTMVIEIEGEGYLLIYTNYRSVPGNVLNNGTQITADVFKLYGNPGIKTRY